MLTPERTAWIKRLAGDGLSQRAIHRENGVSRDSIREVLDDQRRRWPLKDTIYDVEDPIFTGEIGRCPGCGCRVYLPCLACQLRREK